MKKVIIKSAIYNIVSSLETKENILMLVKRPAGKKVFLASMYPDGQAFLRGEMPQNTTAENMWAK